MSRVVVFGIGDYARIASVYLDRDSDHEVVGFTADRSYLDEADELLGRPVVAFEDVPDHFPPDEVSMLVAVGFNRVNRARAEVFERVRGMGYGCVSYVS